VECQVCNADINAFYDLSAEVVRVNASLIKQASFAAGGKILIPGRVVVLRDGVRLLIPNPKIPTANSNSISLEISLSSYGTHLILSSTVRGRMLRLSGSCRWFPRESSLAKKVLQPFWT
jgi:hypothetical protein